VTEGGEGRSVEKGEVRRDGGGEEGEEGNRRRLRLIHGSVHVRAIKIELRSVTAMTSETGTIPVVTQSI
jgi:hypothetical protein